jgi:Holliday junction DNA helicase RuvA
MIAHLRGQLIRKSPGLVILDVHGVGYQIFISLSTFYNLPEPEQTVSLHTYTHVREDLLQLYGFFTILEKELFKMLISVSGIGPKLGLNILSGTSPQELVRALDAGDVARLVSIPGVGRKTAERMLLDLREKTKRLEERFSFLKTEIPLARGVLDDVVSALVNLGYKKGQAETTVECLLKNAPEITLEQALKESLKILSIG